MEEVYIKTADLNRWIAKYFRNKDIISIADLIGVIEDLDGDVERLEEELEDKSEMISQMQNELKFYDPANYH